MKKLVIASGFLLAATLGGTSASLAQYYGYGAPAPYTGGDYYAPQYSTAPGIYDYAPGRRYGLGPYWANPSLNYGAGGDWYDYDRVDQPGRGNSAESTR